ncbi:MAG: bifunctional homocysteine S-methyltransferase/methylenetetrahydrofolate reductase, partial [Spirochaetales bacterium]|nr:bifunctional homocysteine S-methyltransferase/methylenetetrahydrofolate reductase [Spirochaetales bacterium]
MSRKDIREYLEKNILLFDGAMGTYLTSKDRTYRNAPEAANLEKPELIRDIHMEYLQAGSMAITTNTFGANRQNFPDDCDRIIERGYRLAEEAASKYNAFVFADIGPMDIGAIELPEDVDESEHEYIRIAGRFLELGATNFIFETHSIPDGIPEAARFIKEKNPDAFIIASFAVLPDGFTRDGVFASQLAQIIGECPYIDAFGMNCIQDAVHMKEMASRLELNGKILSLMPNAGYPTVLSHRVFYEGDPAFYAQSVADMANVGARILGGCCGTTPLHIKMISKLLPKAAGTEGRKTVAADETADTVTSHFWQKLTTGGRPIAVELDPPENASLAKFMAGATRLRDAGVDILTIADCPIARARMDSSLLACKVRRELDLDVIPHMTCRDRNLNATKALLLGLYAESVRNVLLVTGDPIPTAERDEVKSVYQFNSRKLAAFVSELGRQTLPGGFHIFGALNVNARNFDVQLKLAKEKVSKGMVGFLTQPVLTDTAVQNLKRAKEELDAYILGGLIPIISERNARFMDSEVNGISVSPEIIRQYVGKD